MSRGRGRRKNPSSAGLRKALLMGKTDLAARLLAEYAKIMNERRHSDRTELENQLAVAEPYTIERRLKTLKEQATALGIILTDPVVLKALELVSKSKV